MNRMLEGNNCVQRNLAKLLKCLILSGHGFVMGYIVTPLLWALMIIQMLLSIVMACLYMMLMAAYQSCDNMADAQAKLAQTQAALDELQQSQEEAAAAQAEAQVGRWTP